MSNTSSRAVWWFAGGIILLVGAVIGLAAAFSGKSSSQKTNRELAFSCTTDEATRFHIHPDLEIRINGQKQEIPSGVGSSPTCLHPLHTHDASGKIHVESPEPRDFILSDFFAVWDKAFNKNQILDFKADERHIIKMTVNGQESQEFENLVLRDNDQIVISYGEKK